MKKGMERDKVVIVDDDILVGRMIEKSLESKGKYDVFHFENYEDFIKVENEFDFNKKIVLILDQRIRKSLESEKQGHEFYEYFFEKFKDKIDNLLFIWITGEDKEDILKRINGINRNFYNHSLIFDKPSKMENIEWEIKKYFKKK